MGVITFRQHIIADCVSFSRSSCPFSTKDIAQFVDTTYQAAHSWPAPLVQLNPHFVLGCTIEELVNAGLLPDTCRTIVHVSKTLGTLGKRSAL